MKFVNFKYYPLLFFISIVAFMTMGFIYFTSNHYSKNIKLSDERELKVTLGSGISNLNVYRGNHNNIMDAEIESEKNFDPENCIDYSDKDGIGYLTISTSPDAESFSRKKHSFHFSDLRSSTWDIQFTDAVPISFDIELGMGKGVFDLSGLVVKDLNISTGASSFFLKFDKPNQIAIEDLTIESGLSKFRAEGLCYANFDHMKFEGGVGTYTLDFGGELSKEVDVDLQIGLGSLTVIIPDNIGAKILYEKNFITHIDLDEDFEETEENNYTTSNFNTASGRINMKIEAGLGSVSIKRK